jgi:hypothetical protein
MGTDMIEDPLVRNDNSMSTDMIEDTLVRNDNR